MSDNHTFYCSFCAKTNHEVRKLIAGPTVFICDECVDLCRLIVDEHRAQEETPTPLTEARIREIIREEIDADRILSDGGDAPTLARYAADSRRSGGYRSFETMDDIVRALREASNSTPSEARHA